MKLRVLGCGGGIGGQHQTTSFLIDEDVLIDAGTGLGSLGFPQMCKIDHVFLSHSHMDHIALLPLLADSIGPGRSSPLRVYALEATLKTLQDNIFNWRVWPDFTRVPQAHKPYVEFVALTIGKSVDLSGRRLEPIFANHIVPTAGFHLDSGSGALVFSGDTTCNDALWEHVNRARNVRHLIVESAFSNGDRALAEAAKHYCPALLVEDLKKLSVDPAVYITHTKPGDTQTIMRELGESPRPLTALANAQVLEF